MKRFVYVTAMIILAASLVSGCGPQGEDAGPGTDMGTPPDSGPDVDSGVIPPGGEGCVALGPNDPIVPGGLGACCSGADSGGATAECAAPLGCFNGFCTLLACTTDADCLDTVGPNDRSPFPEGTTFGCVQGDAGNAPIWYCAPLGAGRRECAGGGSTACAAGEVCNVALDPDDFLTALCVTAMIIPEPIPSMGIGAFNDACFNSSYKTCLQDSECRPMLVADIDRDPMTPDEQIEFCNTTTGFCELEAPFGDYQCAGSEGVGEVLMFTSGDPVTGPGAASGMEGGCHATTLGGVPTCTAYCNPSNPSCPGGLECIPHDWWGDSFGMCVGQLCFTDEGPITDDDLIALAPPIMPADPAPCTIDADCTNGGAFGARCIDLECEFTARVVLCPTGEVCARFTWTDQFDQGVDPMDDERTDLDTVFGSCTPENLIDPAIAGLTGDPCSRNVDCLAGWCTDEIFIDPPGGGTCTEICINDAQCLAAATDNYCVNIGLFGNGSTMGLPICLPMAFLEVTTPCNADSTCPAVDEACQFSSGRTGVGFCDDRAGVLADTSTQAAALGVTIADNAQNGDQCFDDINRCSDGDDDVEDSTPADAAAGTCAGDDELFDDNNNCASTLCLDGDDLEEDGDLTDGPRICSALCVVNADCVGPQNCGNVLLTDNSTDDPNDDNWQGWCLNYMPAVAAENCDTGSMAGNDTDCATNIGGDSCDDGMGETSPPSFSCYTSGNNGAVGAPCIEDWDCGAGMGCLDEFIVPATMPVLFTGGYCILGGCAVDPGTGIGSGADCPLGYDAGSGAATMPTDSICVRRPTLAIGACFKACATNDDCRNPGVDYQCAEAIPGDANSMACLPM